MTTGEYINGGTHGDDGRGRAFGPLLRISSDQPEPLNDRILGTDVSNTTNSANGETVGFSLKELYKAMVYFQTITVADDAVGNFTVTPSYNADRVSTTAYATFMHNAGSGTANADFCGRAVINSNSDEQTGNNTWGSSGVFFDREDGPRTSGTAGLDGYVTVGVDYTSDSSTVIQLVNRTGATADFSMWIL